MRRRALLAALGLAGLPLSANAQAAPPVRSLPIGYVERADDARYRIDPSHMANPARLPARPFAGAAMAIDEAALIGRVIGVRFTLRRAAADDVDALARAVAGWRADRVAVVLADLPAADLTVLADRLNGQPVLLLNVSADDDALRGADCRANVAHTLPSAAMRADALVQFLVARRWRDILVLRGETPVDQAATAALVKSAAKFGAHVVRTVPFRLTNDPRQREQSNVALMTADADYDVVDVIDAAGEFAPYVPYATKTPRPVVGDAGLRAHAWHWSWDLHGAIQLNNRFAKAAGRPMRDADWAAWAAVRAVVQAALRTRSTEFAALRAFLIGPRMNLDGYKGNPMSFRPWDRQLRQPLLLATDDAVIARAPLPGFLHRTNELDTLGPDSPETACRVPTPPDGAAP